MTEQRRWDARQEWQDAAEIAVLFLLILLIATYVLLRYRGLWGEADTSGFTWFIRSILETGQLTPQAAGTYPNGYGYQALVVFLLNVSGLSLADLQVGVTMLLVVWLVFPAWLAYRELTGTGRGATLATAFLLVQPEFLFAALRGTHEKFTRGLMLLGLYLLIRSLRSRRNPARFMALVLVFCLTIYGMITFNTLLGISFMAALALALALSWLLQRYGCASFVVAGPAIQRLAYTLSITMILAFLVIFYAYPPAQFDLHVIDSVWARVVMLLRGSETPSSNPYATVTSAWVSLPVYFAVRLANWLLLAASAAIWMWQSARWLRRRQRPRDATALLLWAFYGAFACQGAVSVLVDMSGVLSSNLQHRIFPSFVMVAAPVVARWLIGTGWLSQRAMAGRVVHTGLGISIALLAILSTLKAVNEPLLSNKWMFYSSAEAAALEWAEETLAERPIWVGFDERLFASMTIRSGASKRNAWLYWSSAGFYLRPENFLASDVIRSRGVRLSQPLPVEADSFVTYDNGQAQIYHSRPRTPYQR